MGSGYFHVYVCSQFRRLGNGYFQPFGETFHDRVKIPPRIAVRDGARGVLAANRLPVPDRACGPDVHEQGMGAEDCRAPVGVLLTRGFLRSAVDAGKDDPQLFDELRVCPVGHRPPLQHFLAFPEPVPDFVHEVVEPVVVGLAHDIDVGPQEPQREAAPGALHDLRRGREAFFHHDSGS